MSTMNISLPEALKSFVDEQVRRGGYSEYLRELIRKDQDRLQLRGLLMSGAATAAAAAAPELGLWQNLTRNARPETQDLARTRE